MKQQTINVPYSDYYNDVDINRGLDVMKHFTHDNHDYELVDYFRMDVYSRWFDYWQYVYRRDDDKFFSATYKSGKTENQETEGFQFAKPCTIMLTQVYQK